MLFEDKYFSITYIFVILELICLIEKKIEIKNKAIKRSQQQIN